MTLAEKTREIHESSKAIHAASDAKSWFLANMSHELRTPMNAILGFGQLLKQTTLNSEQSSYINKSQNSAKHMVELINQILDFSKLEEQKQKLELTTFKANDLIKNVIAQIEKHCKAKNLKFVVDIAHDIPEKIYADQLRPASGFNQPF